jgi:predicted nuclease of predicted toxin-antitoxin system
MKTSPHLPGSLADLYPASVHVRHCGLGSADDLTIWQYARDDGFTIISKDSDFQDWSVLRGHPPKFIGLRAANCSSREIENLLQTAGQTIGFRRKPGSSKGGTR